MNRTLILFFLLIVCTIAYTQSKLTVAPVNRDYNKFLDEYESGESEMQAAPVPYNLNFDQYFKLKKSSSPKFYPSVYDMRTAGPGGTSLLTSVKNQSGCGACWAFATYSSIESVWKVMGLGDNDLSENNLKNCSGFELPPCQWGHHFMSTAYLVRGAGIISEIDDPWVAAPQACLGSFTPNAYIPESRYLPEDHDAFKETIMNSGAIYNTFRSTAEGYEWINGHYTFCYQGPSSTSHAIAIVGWDDTITTACGNGAWICKNQYGTNFGEDGYFYISYQDTLVLKYNGIWPEKEEYDPELTIYQYDTIGGWPFVGYEDPVAYGLIKYNAQGAQFVTRIGTYTVSYGTYLEVDIYDDFDGVNLTNHLASIPETYCDYPGYWTLDLAEALRFDTGEDFYIRVKYNSPGIDWPIAIETFSDGYTDPFIETGKCWTREETGPWEELGEGTTFVADLCIKAYAYDVLKLDIKVMLEGPFNGSSMNTDLNNIPLNQPYNTSPWNYHGTESVVSIPANVVDWVLVELRDTLQAENANSSTVIARQAAFLLDDGSVVGIDGASTLKFNNKIDQQLFVVVYHRNHLPVMSALPLTKANGIFEYDFSSGIDKSYGGAYGNKHLGSGIYGMIGGDGVQDGTIDDFDILDIWKQQSGEAGYKEGDYNLDKDINNQDKNEIWVPNNGSGSQVPE
jgi:C1A family cysteine protease